MQTVQAMSLTCLPTELIESVVTHLDLSAFCSFRLVSTSLEKQSLHVFRDRFFRRRLILWAKQDLEKLREISAHAAFGTALRHLSINATPRYSISLWQLRKRISEADAIFSEPNGVFFKSELQEQYIEIDKEAKELSTYFKETRYDQKCMQVVFDKVQNLESIEFGYEGMDKKYGKFARRYCESSQYEMSRPFVSTMAAIAASGLQVKSISMHCRHHYGAISIGRLESLAPSLGIFGAAFEKLETLHLSLRDWRIPEDGFELESNRAPFVVRFLSKARNVKHLSLDCYSVFDNDLLGEMARNCMFAKLITCQLAHFRLHKASDLLRLFESASSTIVELSLSNIELRDNEVTWADLFSHVATSDEVLPGMKWMKFVKLFSNGGLEQRFHYGWRPYELVVGTRTATSYWREELLAHIDRFSSSMFGPARHLAAVAYPFVGMGI
jgi:hypothetical protein